MRQIVERQIEAEATLCGAIFRLMIDHRYSVYEVRDAVDLLTGELYKGASRLRTSPRPTPEALAGVAFGGLDSSSLI